ncbi:protein translocase subunit SecD [Patescibacteria group bacterium]|nr:protein translocase subunit SecD [Patescibacteria group bacterium]MBU4057560.1 protein translocase subunit SecD [Patescibacteria group bacterium]MBU4115592.1 protein translocase subunit SecD [Patescibacteria group bacterium]
MLKIRIIAIILLIAGVAIGFFLYNSETDPNSSFHFKLGLDLASGTHLEYKADTSKLQKTDISSSMEALRSVVEKRINVFGVSEPIIQVESGGLGNFAEKRLIVELPGVTDINKAIEMIGKTPLLEFKLLNKNYVPTEEEKKNNLVRSDAFIDTGLTGRLLKGSRLEFGANGGFANEPVVSLSFNSEGTDLFAKITKEHIGEVLAIFLDGQPISLPVIQQEIPDGNAQITGKFTPEEAKQLVRDLNLGALPVPIELISTNSVGASLGKDVLNKGIFAGIIGIIFVLLFLIFLYRLPGFIAVLALGMYIVIMLSLFKLIPVVLTAAGIAGFILSIGMAIDANILIFERMREELNENRDNMEDAIKNGFSRAWLSIRDSNISSIITAVVLFWFGTSLIKGFALTFGIGVLVSMISAISISRTFLLSIYRKHPGEFAKFMFGSGFKS